MKTKFIMQVPEIGGTVHPQGCTGKIPAWSGGRRQEREKRSLTAFIGVFPGKAKQGSFGLSSLDNLIRIWAVGVVSNCLVPGPGISKTEEYCLLGCHIEEVSLRRA